MSARSRITWEEHVECESLVLGEQRFRIILHLPQRRQFHFATTVATHRAAVHVMEGTRLVRRACADNASRLVFLHFYLLPASLQSSLSERAWRELAALCFVQLTNRWATRGTGVLRSSFQLRRACSRSRIMSVGLLGHPCMIAAFSARQVLGSQAAEDVSEKLVDGQLIPLVMPARDIGRRRPPLRARGHFQVCRWHIAQRQFVCPSSTTNIILSSQAT